MLKKTNPHFFFFRIIITSFSSFLRYNYRKESENEDIGLCTQA